jgi:cobalt-zinc-cadmium efflux system protein
MLHDHDHAAHPHDYSKAFAWGVGLNLAFIVVEASAGLLVNSLALLADAGHNLSDVLGLLLAWAAHYLSHLPPTSRRTYGWRSTSILAALFNALILLVAIGGIAWEALRRFAEPAEVIGTTVIWVAAVGVVINTATAFLFLRGRHEDLNIRGAFLHMAADAGLSLGVVLAGVGIIWTGWLWIDPATSLLIALVIFISTWQLLRESFDLALHAVPKGIDTEDVKHCLNQLPGVQDVHDLHIWAMSTTETALTAHLICPQPSDSDALLADAGEQLHEQFGIEHTTLQIERQPEAASCRQACRKPN